MSKSTVIALLDAEIERLQQARKLLSGGDTSRSSRSSTTGNAPRTGRRTRRRMSAEAKRRISLAQKKRWAARKRAAKAD